MTSDELIAIYLTTNKITKCETRNGLDSNATRVRKNHSFERLRKALDAIDAEERFEQMQDDNFNRAS